MAAGIKKLFRGAEEGMAERKLGENRRKVGNTKAGIGRSTKKSGRKKRAQPGRNVTGTRMKRSEKEAGEERSFFRFVRRFFGRAENERRDDGDQNTKENEKGNLRGRH